MEAKGARKVLVFPYRLSKMPHHTSVSKPHHKGKFRAGLLLFCQALYIYSFDIRSFVSLTKKKIFSNPFSTSYDIRIKKMVIICHDSTDLRKFTIRDFKG